jgi:hypothetical protein
MQQLLQQHSDEREKQFKSEIFELHRPAQDDSQTRFVLRDNLELALFTTHTPCKYTHSKRESAFIFGETNHQNNSRSTNKAAMRPLYQCRTQ